MENVIGFLQLCVLKFNIIRAFYLYNFKREALYFHKKEFCHFQWSLYWFVFQTLSKCSFLLHFLLPGLCQCLEYFSCIVEITFDESNVWQHIPACQKRHSQDCFCKTKSVHSTAAAELSCVTYIWWLCLPSFILISGHIQWWNVMYAIYTFTLNELQKTALSP